MDTIKNKVWYYSRFQNLVMYDENVGTYEKLIYCVICLHADKEDNTCFPSFNRIATLAGCSRRKAIDAVNNLVEAGYIKKTKRKDDIGNNKSNLYQIVDLSYVEVFRKLAKSKNKEKEFDKRLDHHPIPSEEELNDLVNDMHHPSELDSPPSESHAPGVVNLMHHPSESHAPELESLELDSFEQDSSSSKEEENFKIKFKSVFGDDPSIGQTKVLRRYIEMFSCDLVDYALDVAAMYNAKKPIYLVKLLEDWKNRGLTTVKKAKKEIEEDDHKKTVSDRSQSKVRGTKKYEFKEVENPVPMPEWANPFKK